MKKDFNLEAAKAGKAVCTKEGLEVRILCFDLKSANYPIVAAITRENGIETIGRYTTDGEYEYPREHNLFDLMMAPEKKTMWTNIYKVGNNGCNNVGLYLTEKAALDNISTNYGSYIATAKVEWEE